MKPKVTQRDVARQAGVSQTAVSLVLGNKADAAISEECRQRVLAACLEVGYQPPHRQTMTLGILLNEWLAREYHASTYYARFYHGLIQTAANLGYYLIPHVCDTSAGVPAIISEGRVDGVIIQDKASPSFLRKIQAERPCVLLNIQVPELAITSIMPDNSGGIALAVRHLYEAGHRRIAFFGLGDPKAEGVHQSERYAGYTATMRELGLAPITYFTPAQKPDYSDALLRTAEAAAGLYSLQPRPTAVLSYGDVHILRFIDAARNLGWSAPEELSLIGFDNTDFCNFSSPPLTSVDQPLEDMAAAAVSELVATIADPDRAVRSLRFDTRLHERQSVMPPK